VVVVVCWLYHVNSAGARRQQQELHPDFQNIKTREPQLLVQQQHQQQQQQQSIQMICHSQAITASNQSGQS